MKSEPWMFMPGHTIEAIIKLKNGYNITKDQLQQLVLKFNELNGSRVPKVGENFQIPLL